MEQRYLRRRHVRAEPVWFRLAIGSALVALGVFLILRIYVTLGAEAVILPAVTGLGWVFIGGNLIRKRRS
jgi:hypothetical protein